MKSKISICICLLLAVIINSLAQVKIGDNSTTINSNSLLELESTTKGFLPPRVALNDVNSISPLTGTVPTGMMVYSIAGTLANGFYSWDGTKWVPFISIGEPSVVTKTANATLTKAETFVIASNDITLILPVVTAADNGLAITIKNIGTHTNQVLVDGNGAATIDNVAAASKLFRWMSRTYVALNGNWIIKGIESRTDNVFDVSATGSWTTIAEVIAFLNLHMTGPSVVRLVGGDYPITLTQVINLPYAVTFQGVSYGAATITAVGLSGAMFSCLSETYFKMLAFDGTGHLGAGTGDNAINLVTAGEYFEVKDCTFDLFDKAIEAQSNVDFWVFEVDISNAVTAGIELAAGVTTGISFKISETDFIDCNKGINLLSGAGATVSILNCGFYNPTGTGIGINYVPATFTTLSTGFITNNTWNNQGTFISGFDFTRTDGRDANTFIRNNSGGGDQNPKCRINVNNSIATTTLTTAGTWYKANWTNTSSITVKWTVANNRITYQPVNRSNAFMVITGNIAVTNANRTISIAIVKNGVTATRYGETDLRVKNANQPEVFATTIYIDDIGPNDYFELYLTSANSGDIVTFQDVQWFTENK